MHCVQEVIVLGSGAFACEAMEAAIANNAKHVTMVCRDRKRSIPSAKNLSSNTTRFKNCCSCAISALLLSTGIPYWTPAFPCGPIHTSGGIVGYFS